MLCCNKAATFLAMKAEEAQEVSRRHSTLIEISFKGRPELTKSRDHDMDLVEEEL